MVDMKQIIKHLLAEILDGMGVLDAGIAVEVPENSLHGDYTTNVAMLLAGRLKAPPLKIAQQIVDTITKHQKESGGENLDWLEKAEVAPPGFINLWLSEHTLGNQLEKVLKEKETYGMVSKTTGLASSEADRVGILGKKGQKNLTQQKRSPKPAKIETKTVMDLPTGTTDAGKEAKNEPLASFGKRKQAQRSPEHGRRTVMVEFAHPNTHKAFHIGHLRNITTGESIVRLLEAAGHRVIRVNYQGDVGMHIAKALYALLELAPYKDEVDTVKGVKARVEFLGKAYAAGSTAFEEDEKAKATIIDLNALIYASAQKYAREVGRNPGTTDYVSLVKNHVHPLDRVYALWKETRQWSLDYFETIYERVGSHYDRLYFESECLAGVDLAKDAVKKGVLKESDGAIVFDGKAHGIDTRVFVNSLGLPTYEGKELALSRMETAEFGTIDRLIHVVGPEQASFFIVTFKAEELLGFVEPGVQHHLIYGWVKLKKGKMSSRLGNVVLGEWLLDEAKKSIYKILQKTASTLTSAEQEEIAEAGAIAAVKYAFLKVGTKQEIAFDLVESVSFEGDSGPYLLYSYARCKSVLRKSSVIPAFEPESREEKIWIPGQARDDKMNPEERAIARRISQFPDVVAEAAGHFTPNTLCTYLFHLAQEFNLFYAKHPILGQPLRLALTAVTAQVMKNGLYLLGIPVVERM